jgi:hypothetical protein
LRPDAIPHRPHPRDGYALTPLSWPALRATIVVADPIDAFPAVLAPIFGIVVVHILSSSLARLGVSPHRTG